MSSKFISIRFESCKHLNISTCSHTYCTFTLASDNNKEIDSHLFQLKVLSKNNKILFLAAPSALCLTNSRYDELLGSSRQSSLYREFTVPCWPRSTLLA